MNRYNVASDSIQGNNLQSEYLRRLQALSWNFLRLDGFGIIRSTCLSLILYIATIETDLLKMIKQLNWYNY